MKRFEKNQDRIIIGSNKVIIKKFKLGHDA